VIVFRDLPWYYAEMLDWHVEGDIVKAFPKRRLSMVAHKTILRVFRRWGGKFVSHNGDHYFELVIGKGVSSTSTQTAVDIKRAYERIQKEA